MSLLLSLNVQQAVSVPQLGHALRTHGDLGVLAVRHQSVANAGTAADGPRNAGTTGFTGLTWKQEQRESWTAAVSVEF